MNGKSVQQLRAGVRPDCRKSMEGGIRMRIEAYTQVQQLYNAKKVSKTQAKSSAGHSDKLQISGFGRDIQVAKQAVAASQDVREELTASIKSQIQAGTYDVGVDRFADKLMQRYEEMG